MHPLPLDSRAQRPAPLVRRINSPLGNAAMFPGTSSAADWPAIGARPPPIAGWIRPAGFQLPASPWGADHVRSGLLSRTEVAL